MVYSQIQWFLAKISGYWAPGPVPRGTTRVRTMYTHPHTPGTTHPPTTPCTTTPCTVHPALAAVPSTLVSVFRKLTPSGCLEKPVSAYIRPGQTCPADWTSVSRAYPLAREGFLAKSGHFGQKEVISGQNGNSGPKGGYFGPKWEFWPKTVVFWWFLA